MSGHRGSRLTYFESKDLFPKPCPSEVRRWSSTSAGLFGSDLPDGESIEMVCLDGSKNEATPDEAVDAAHSGTVYDECAAEATAPCCESIVLYAVPQAEGAQASDRLEVKRLTTYSRVSASVYRGVEERGNNVALFLASHGKYWLVGPNAAEDKVRRVHHAHAHARSARRPDMRPPLTRLAACGQGWLIGDVLEGQQSLCPTAVTKWRVSNEISFYQKINHI